MILTGRFFSGRAGREMDDVTREERRVFRHGQRGSKSDGLVGC